MHTTTTYTAEDDAGFDSLIIPNNYMTVNDKTKPSARLVPTVLFYRIILRYVLIILQKTLDINYHLYIKLTENS